jgi:hypothetical protein
MYSHIPYPPPKKEKTAEERRADLVDVICVSTGWFPDWKCTKELADKIEALNGTQEVRSETG